MTDPTPHRSVPQTSLPATPPVAGQSYVRSLDSIRFFAFFAVFLFHAFHFNKWLGPVVFYGGMGVQVFFVLSGFLIGGILLELREQTDIPLRSRLMTFYIRRGLRIFPLYYMTLVLIALLPSIGITAIGGRDTFWWYVAYLSNVKMYIDHNLPGGLAHFWSLAVEEHFYLLSPLLMLTLSVRSLNIGFVLIWIGCLVARILFGLAGDEEAYLLSPMQFDCITLGIAAAVIQARGSFLGIGPKTAMSIA